MKQLSSMLSVLFAGLFWVFRVVLAYTSATGKDLGFPIQDFTVEVILLFVVLILLVLIYKRKLLAGIIYFLLYLGYFGPQLFNAIMEVATATEGVSIYTYDTIIASAIGIGVSLFAFLNILADRNRAAHPTDKKTDWFYKNEEYDRKLDDRADKNNYRTL
ncbi:MAG: hypothetical protein ACLSW4_00040 [Clostridia bacterium]|mgnify:FL=1|jgi:hypothetical protein|nr:hypothetical protein [Clostridium sp.]MEE0126982.1 hypothetical protein [Clostridia bacterium]HJJ13059.1 hypothetical protein [Clostridiaceae bacterium]